LRLDRKDQTRTVPQDGKPAATRPMWHPRRVTTLTGMAVALTPTTVEDDR
jgi:hypothetical protein